MFVRAPNTVAAELERWLLDEAADGFIAAITVPSEFARFEKVLPILRERGIFRSEYESDTPRGNLGLPVPVNFHTAMRQAQTVAV
jgi:hypothetical protein